MLTPRSIGRKVQFSFSLRPRHPLAVNGAALSVYFRLRVGREWKRKWTRAGLRLSGAEATDPATAAARPVKRVVVVKKVRLASLNVRTCFKCARALS